MAQFRAVIQGNRGKASRLGTKSTGMYANVNGWNLGIQVDASHIDGKDVFTVYKTGGSNAGYSREKIATITKDKITADFLKKK